MAKTKKKVDVKKVEKERIMAVVTEALESAGFTAFDGEEFGFTAGTVVIRTEKCDIQLKPISPKAGVTHYEKLPVEEEVVEGEAKEEAAATGEKVDETPAPEGKSEETATF